MANKNFVVHNGLTAGNVTIDAASGNVTATKFIGDGSLLTGVSGAGAVSSSDVANLLATGTTTIGNLTVSSKVVGNLIPSANITYTLGSLTHQWKDLYVGPGSIYVNGNKVLEQVSDTVIFSADPNQNIAIRTLGTGDIELNPANTGVITMKGAVQFDDSFNIGTTSNNPISLAVGLKTPSISASGTNATLTLAGTGTGSISLNDDVTVTGNLTVTGTTTALNVTNLNVQDNIVNISNGTTGAPTLNSGLQVMRGDEPNVQFRWNESIDRWQFTNDGTTYANLVSSSDVSTIASYGNANVAAYLPTYTGNISGSNLNLTGTITTTGTTGNISGVKTLTATTVSANTVVAGNISISATADAITSTFGTITIDPNPVGSGGNVIIQGNLQVTGTTTTVNSTTVEVADLNITLAKGSATAAAANGAGLTIDGASATFTYASTGDKWAANKPLDVTGNVTAGNVSATNLTGTLTTATQTNITSVGNLTALNASGNISTTGNVVAAKFYGDGSALTGISAGSSYTNANVAAYLPTYTGNIGGSNLNLTGTITTSGTNGNIAGVNNLSATTLTGTLTTAAQTNITSVGNLTALNASGNISTTGNVVAVKFYGDGSALTGIAAGSSYGNANVAAYLPTYTGNIGGNITLSGTITTSGSNGNISGVNVLSATTVTANTVSTVSGTYTGTQSFTGNASAVSSVFTNSAELVTISGTAASSPINYDVTTQSILYYTANSAANVTVNFRGSSGTSLNTLMATGQTVTAALILTQGTTAYYPNTIQVDGAAVTPKWAGGTAVTAGNASSIDMYSYTIVKTGNATFTVFASQTKFA